MCESCCIQVVTAQVSRSSLLHHTTCDYQQTSSYRAAAASQCVVAVRTIRRRQVDYDDHNGITGDRRGHTLEATQLAPSSLYRPILLHSPTELLYSAEVLHNGRIVRLIGDASSGI